MDEGHTVLVVEDDASVAHTFARILRLGDYHVVTVQDAETALRELEALRPDAVLLDLRMPGGDGLRFLRSLRALERDRERQTPVAVITGDYTLDDAMCGELAGLGALLYFKPVWLEDLLGIARQLIEQSAPGR